MSSSRREKNREILRTGNFGPGRENQLLATPGVMELGEAALGDLVHGLMRYPNTEAGLQDESLDFGEISFGDNKVWFKIDPAPTAESQDACTVTLLLPSEY